jgi:serine phosphatase RsbU (regulator of sigma subunit)
LHKAVLKSIPASLGNGKVKFGSQYLPAERDILIGGDFYDVIELGPFGNRIAMVIGDVAGHGVEAAAQTSMVLTALRAYSVDAGLSPSRILTRTVKIIEPHLESFVSLFFGIYDINTRRLVYSNAGHEPPILFRKGHSKNPIALNPTGAIFGIGLNDYDEASVEFDSGDVIVLLTDGLTEVRTHGGEMLGWDGIASIASSRVANYSDAQKIADGIVSDARWVSKHERLADDIALLVAMAL